MHKRTICTIFSILLLTTACTTTDPRPVETAPETDTTAAAETQQEAETETEPETEAAPVSDAQIQYDNITVWESSTGTLWYTAVVEVANLGETTLQLSNCTLDVEDANGALVATLDLGSSVPEVIDPGETAYYVDTSTLDAALPEGYKLVPHAKFGEHAAPVRYPVSEVSLKDTDYFGVKAVCRIENDTDESISSPRVAVILLGADGHAVAQLLTYGDEIAPGEKMGVELGALSMAPGITADSVSGYVAYAEPMFQW